MAALDDAQAFLGSFMSLITESELRYEGYLFYLNTRESTIGLRNGFLFISLFSISISHTRTESRYFDLQFDFATCLFVRLIF